jgi:serine/threonine protein kinase
MDGLRQYGDDNRLRTVRNPRSDEVFDLADTNDAGNDTSRPQSSPSARARLQNPPNSLLLDTTSYQHTMRPLYPPQTNSPPQKNQSRWNTPQGPGFGENFDPPPAPVAQLPPLTFPLHEPDLLTTRFWEESSVYVPLFASSRPTVGRFNIPPAPARRLSSFTSPPQTTLSRWTAPQGSMFGENRDSPPTLAPRLSSFTSPSQTTLSRWTAPQGSVFGENRDSPPAPAPRSSSFTSPPQTNPSRWTAPQGSVFGENHDSPPAPAPRLSSFTSPSQTTLSRWTAPQGSVFGENRDSPPAPAPQSSSFTSRRPTAPFYDDLPAPAPQSQPHGVRNFDDSVFPSTASPNAATQVHSSFSSLIHNVFWNGGHRILGPTDKDPFIVSSFLGHGSVGVVEEVSYTIESRISWVRKKVPLPQHLRTQKLRIIQQEAKVLNSLDHVHIVKLLGSYEDAIRRNRPSMYCLLMSPVGDGDLKIFLNQSLQSRIQEGRMQEVKWLQKWFVCLASALKYMHAQGVRHEDIKSSNIVHHGGTIYFTDFSSSSQFEIGQTTSTDNPSQASALYAAPEVSDRIAADGSFRRHGLGSDIFALGCVFSEMLTVLYGASLSSFHEFLLNDTDLNEGGSLLYNRKVHKFDEWFERLRVSSPENVNLFGFLYDLPIFDICIRHMLAEDRTSRPDAAQVLLWTRTCIYFPGSLTCSCSLS